MLNSINTTNIVYYTPYYLSSSSFKSLSSVIHSPRLLHGSLIQKQDKGLDGPARGPADPIYLSEMRSISLHRQPNLAVQHSRASTNQKDASAKPHRHRLATREGQTLWTGADEPLWLTCLTLAFSPLPTNRHGLMASGVGVCV